MQEIDEWLLRVEIMWKKRARIDWIREGDSNTKIFHRRASSRKSKNKIISLEDNEGRSCNDDESHEVFIIDCFKNIFKSEVNLSNDDWE